MDKVEKLARVICFSQTGYDPDTIGAIGGYNIISGTELYVPIGELMPIWKGFEQTARAVLAAGFDCPDDPAPIETLSDEEISAVTNSASVSGDFHASEDFPAPSDGSAWRERLNRMGLG